MADPLANGQVHMHTVCVLTSDLTSPPAGGVTYTTSTVLDHDHTVMLTQAQLQSVQSGGSVTVTTSTTGNHMHMFTVTKA